MSNVVPANTPPTIPSSNGMTYGPGPDPPKPTHPKLLIEL